MWWLSSVQFCFIFLFWWFKFSPIIIIFFPALSTKLVIFQTINPSPTWSRSTWSFLFLVNLSVVVCWRGSFFLIESTMMLVMKWEGCKLDSRQLMLQIRSWCGYSMRQWGIVDCLDELPDMISCDAAMRNLHLEKKKTLQEVTFQSMWRDGYIKGESR